LFLELRQVLAKFFGMALRFSLELLLLDGSLSRGFIACFAAPTFPWKASSFARALVTCALVGFGDFPYFPDNLLPPAQ